MLMTKNTQDRAFRGFRLSAATRETLQELAQEYQTEAPPYLKVSQRVLVEALIDHARRTKLPFSELFSLQEK